jgi:hypothetical protein
VGGIGETQSNCPEENMSHTNRVTAVDSEPNQDGDNTMQVTCADGTAIDVTIDLGAAQKLVEILQQRLVHWAHEAPENLRFPQAEVIDVAVTRPGQEAQLMVSTTQIGWWVLIMSDDTLRKTQREVDRLSGTQGFLSP